MLVRSQAEIDQEAEQNRRSLLRAESAALLLLLNRRNQAVKAGLAVGASARSIADRIETSWRRGLVDARSLSRAAGMARLRSEASSMGFGLGRGAAVIQDELLRDTLRARSGAHSFAARWLRLADGVTVREATKNAADATLGSLRRIGVTESSEAFSAGRAKYLRTATVQSLAKVWDASLDKRVCPTCADAEGTIVGFDESFPQGEPGSVHPFCRCGWTLVSLVESKEISEAA